MQRAHRDSLPKLVQPGRRRDKWLDEQAGNWVRGGPEESTGFVRNRGQVRANGAARRKATANTRNPKPQPAQPWKLKKKAASGEP